MRKGHDQKIQKMLGSQLLLMNQTLTLSVVLLHVEKRLRKKNLQKLIRRKKKMSRLRKKTKRKKKRKKKKKMKRKMKRKKM